MPEPEIAVVIPSHGRLLRARWLLNALEEQTLERSRFEVVLVHDYPARTAKPMLERHPLAGEGTLRTIAVAPEDAGAARQRNVGWRAARAPVVAFTDDDCRPEPGWLEALLAAARRQPGAVVQGRVRPDPLEHEVFAGVLVRSLEVEPPDPLGQTANILYPRALLERLRGFDETLRVGEDVDLRVRARAHGAVHVAASEALVNHAVEAFTLVGWWRVNRKWRDLPALVKRHPRLRRHHALGVFWTWGHLRVWVAVSGVCMAPWRPGLALLTLPYLREALGRRGPTTLGRVAALIELPRRFAGDVAEVSALAHGSLRHRTLLL